MFFCEKFVGGDRKLFECLLKTLLKVLRRGLFCCLGFIVGFFFVGFEESVGILMGWVRLLVGELERLFFMVERFGFLVVRVEFRILGISLEELVVMKRVFFFVKDVEFVE